MSFCNLLGQNDLASLLAKILEMLPHLGVLSSFWSVFIKKMCFGWLRCVGFCTFHICFVITVWSNFFQTQIGWKTISLTSACCVWSRFIPSTVIVKYPLRRIWNKHKDDYLLWRRLMFNVNVGRNNLCHKQTRSLISRLQVFNWKTFLIRALLNAV